MPFIILLVAVGAWLIVGDFLFGLLIGGALTAGLILLTVFGRALEWWDWRHARRACRREQQARKSIT